MRSMPANRIDVSPYRVIEEPLLSFDLTDPSQRALNPQLGLTQHGPFSARHWPEASATVRIAMLSPEGDLPKLKHLLNEIRSDQRPQERRDYLPYYPGFRGAFRSPLVPAPDVAQLSLDPDLDSWLGRASTPDHESLAPFSHSLRQLKAVESLLRCRSLLLAKAMAGCLRGWRLRLTRHDQGGCSSARPPIANHHRQRHGVPLEGECRVAAWPGALRQSGWCALQTRHQYRAPGRQRSLRRSRLCDAEAGGWHYRLHCLCEPDF